MINRRIIEGALDPEIFSMGVALLNNGFRDYREKGDSTDFVARLERERWMMADSFGFREAREFSKTMKDVTLIFLAACCNSVFLLRFFSVPLSLSLSLLFPRSPRRYGAFAGGGSCTRLQS